MNLTNHDNLPAPIIKAILADDYTRGGADYSASDLIAPPQQVILKRRYWSQLSEDASDKVWSLFGKMTHYLLEKQGIKDALQEERLHTVVMDRKISGQPDLYCDGKVTDYKTTSVFTAIYGSRKKEWEAQLNIYAELLETYGFPVTELEIVCFYRDWSAVESSRYKERYPKKCEVLKLELWPKERRKEYIEAAVALLKLNEEMTDDNLQPCSDEDMWAKADSYAVVKVGGVRAARVLDTQAEAEKFVSEQKKPGDYEIRMRPGAHTRCENYCPARDFCSQYMNWTLGSEENETGEAQ